MASGPRLKARIRAVVATLAGWTGLLGRQERRIASGLTVLCYHRVLPEPMRRRYHDPDLVVTTDAFRQHCRILSQHYDVLPLHEALRQWPRPGPASRPLAAITFDDGYRDNYAYAAPILAEFGLLASFFVVVGLIGTDQRPWYDRAGAALQSLGRDAKAEVARAKRLSAAERARWVGDLEVLAPAPDIADDEKFMTAEQVRSLAALGHEIGSHTMSHPLLPQCTSAELDTEIGQSRVKLEQLLNAPVSGFCYPNGDSTDEICRRTTAAGYAYAVSVVPGVNEPSSFDGLHIKRWFINQERLAGFGWHSADDLLRMEVSGLAQRWFGRAGSA